MSSEGCGMLPEENGFVAVLHYVMRAISKSEPQTMLLVR
ncbi:hypothetical protein yberc0001_18710 [Yersinia bercovieri ATCC 43970]|uniref:Uncharacterized protein n=1 Tax=Yersinia bercovieri ATCC 43970 TaxID=349968 RepID=A0ABM9XYC0_YERBE|nr:hypothetical protein yberc0001_18710 [Yersinia bercovieri ATCC 43970]CFQ36669.1 Uncharacterised protein [Yersinia bercovieri]CNH77425.1 Uncharacterised protein [Yersinia bercovieri]